jgi:O-acetylhomoserine/O-acetylserine sulfhydrylase-like pyridoxal-dependent enzyme
LYGGTYTLFNNELPRYGIEGEFSWYCEVFMLAKRINA